MEAIHISKSKKKAKEEGGIVVFEDEASFRQDSTLHRTWSRIGDQPLVNVTGARRSVKLFGAVELYSGRLLCQESKTSKFNADSYLDFLHHIASHNRRKKIFLIHDNASYHHDEEVVEFFHKFSDWIVGYFLPPYSPELNPIECIWGYFRRTGTHNQFFKNIDEVRSCIRRVKKNIQNKPSTINGYLKTFM